LREINVAKVTAASNLSARLYMFYNLFLCVRPLVEIQLSTALFTLFMSPDTNGNRETITIRSFSSLSLMEKIVSTLVGTHKKYL